MTKFIKVLCCFFILAGLISSQGGEIASAAENCSEIKTGSKIVWKGQEVKPGQVGRATVLKSAKLYKADGTKVRTAKPKEKLRIYSIRSQSLDLGNGVFIKRDSKIKLERIPEKQREQASCLQQKNLKSEAGQMIVVKPVKGSKTKAVLQRYKKQKGKWVKVSAPMSALLGKKGVGKTKEGDAYSPEGTYLLGHAFGWGKKPSSLDLSFKHATKHDYWIDDTSSIDYNKWVHFKGSPSKRWKSYERMTHPLYKYGIVIRYNDAPIVNGDGSAIFLHTRTKSTAYTLGCVAVYEKDLVTLLKWLDSSKKPIIEIKK
ncbi:L,D-transpeptidase family protein [Mesobacillus foraminis]|uniref:L,D-transpeptidase family protein n=1 Tax=Mesobacillus foraminis TaxID=279826 RepID=UPI00214C8D4C|nr:L,D-transpeptidase family protein [Mesobacillus foraminis]